MATPHQAIEGTRRAHQRLLAALSELTDEAARRPSLLPQWSVGHVLTHLARNADSVVRRLEGARRGVTVDQYPGGASGRAAEIEAGAGRPARELVADVARTAAEVESACQALTDDPSAWDRPARRVDGPEVPTHRLVFSRWREVEVHHVDLGLGYAPADWPAALVDAWLPVELGRLPARVEPHRLLAWTIGRGPAPQLGPW